MFLLPPAVAFGKRSRFARRGAQPYRGGGAVRIVIPAAYVQPYGTDEHLIVVRVAVEREFIDDGIVIIFFPDGRLIILVRFGKRLERSHRKDARRREKHAQYAQKQSEKVEPFFIRFHRRRGRGFFRGFFRAGSLFQRFELVPVFFRRSLVRAGGEQVVKRLRFFRIAVSFEVVRRKHEGIIIPAHRLGRFFRDLLRDERGLFRPALFIKFAEQFLRFAQRVIFHCHSALTVFAFLRRKT